MKYNFEIKTILLILTSVLFAVKAGLLVKPRDTEAVTGDSPYFHCASNANLKEIHWYHFAVGAKDHEDICLYCLGTVHPKYENRIEVERNVGTGNYSRLRLKSVQRQDAGRYICQDNGGTGESASAQLVILELGPTCTSNMKPDGVLGPNDCGLEPDTLHLSCQVSYHGNIPPLITWRKSGTDDPVNTLFCQIIGNLVTCNLAMTVDLGLNDAYYICETNRSTTTRYNCVSDIIRVIYAKINNSTNETTEVDEKKVYCSVNSSLSCRHTWKWFDGVHEEVVANDSALIARRPGWHKCEAECIIRGEQCTMLSKLVYVSEQKSLSMPVATAIIVFLSIFAVDIVIVCLFFICLKKPKFGHTFWRRREESLRDDEDLDILGRPDDEEQQSSLGTTPRQQKKHMRRKHPRVRTDLSTTNGTFGATEANSNREDVIQQPIGEYLPITTTGKRPNNEAWLKPLLLHAIGVGQRERTNEEAVQAIASEWGSHTAQLAEVVLEAIGLLIGAEGVPRVIIPLYDGTAATPILLLPNPETGEFQLATRALLDQTDSATTMTSCIPDPGDILPVLSLRASGEEHKAGLGATGKKDEPADELASL